MEINHAFSTLVAFEKLELSNREDVIKFCYQEVENGPKPGVPQSGFFDLTDPVLEELLTKLTGCFNHLHKAVDLIDEAVRSGARRAPARPNVANPLA